MYLWWFVLITLKIFTFFLSKCRYVVYNFVYTISIKVLILDMPKHFLGSINVSVIYILTLHKEREILFIFFYIDPIRSNYESVKKNPDRKSF